MLLRGIYNCILNMMFRGSHYEHSYWIRQSSGSSLDVLQYDEIVFIFDNNFGFHFEEITGGASH